MLDMSKAALEAPHLATAVICAWLFIIYKVINFQKVYTETLVPFLKYIFCHQPTWVFVEVSIAVSLSVRSKLMELTVKMIDHNLKKNISKDPHYVYYILEDCTLSN